MADQDQQRKPLFPIGVVMEQTGLTARQIRYYEEQQLIQPARTDTKRRMYSFHDIDRLQLIKEHLDNGINIAGIRKIFKDLGIISNKRNKEQVSNAEAHKILREELKNAGFGQSKQQSNLFLKNKSKF